MQINKPILLLALILLAACTASEDNSNNIEESRNISIVTITTPFDESNNYALRDAVGMNLHADRSGIPVALEFDDADPSKFEFWVGRECDEALTISKEILNSSATNSGFISSGDEVNISISCSSKN